MAALGAKNTKEMSMKKEKPAICFEEGLDEAFLIGTFEELENFANEILSQLKSPNESMGYLGVKVTTQIPSGALTQSLGQVELHNILVVDSKEARRELMNNI